MVWERRQCYEPGCHFWTPGLTTKEEEEKKLWHHVQSEHPVDKIEDINARDGSDDNHSPALVRATKYRMIDRCAELILRGANIETENDYKNTALSWAALMGFLKICQLLVSHGADLEHKNKEGDTPLALATWANKYPVAQYLMSVGAKVENIKQTDYRTQLMIWGAEDGDMAMVIKTLLAGADVNGKKLGDGRTALELAVANKHNEMCRYLISNGAIVSTDEAEKLVFLAVEKEDFRLCKSALEAGAEVDFQDRNKKTALHHASIRESIEIASLLMAAGASTEIRDRENKTPVDYAKKVELVKALTTDSVIPMDLLWINNTNKYLSLIQKSLKENNKDTKVLSFLGIEDEIMFHHRKVKEKSLLEHLKENGETMVREMMMLNDVLIDVDNISKFEQDGREERIVNQLKSGLPSSPWLRDAISNVYGRFSWNSMYYYTMIFISFTSFAVGYGSYSLDITTDISFIRDQFRLANSSLSKPNCQPNITEIIQHCKDSYKHKECLHALEGVTTSLEKCAETEKRFDDPEEWRAAGWISAFHCIAPLLLPFLVWFIVNKKKGRFSIWTLPLPIITKFQQFLIEWKRIKNNREKNEKDKIGYISDKYKKKNAEIEKELEDNQSRVNISVVIEAAIESSFQFWFQTVYLIPTIFLSFMVIDDEGTWSDLFNLRIWNPVFVSRLFSIFLSFATFSWTFCSIEY